MFLSEEGKKVHFFLFGETLLHLCYPKKNPRNKFLLHPQPLADPRVSLHKPETLGYKTISVRVGAHCQNRFRLRSIKLVIWWPSGSQIRPTEDRFPFFVLTTGRTVWTWPLSRRGKVLVEGWHWTRQRGGWSMGLLGIRSPGKTESVGGRAVAFVLYLMEGFIELVVWGCFL